MKADKNIPQVIGGGFVLLGVGSLIFALPHFITPEYHGGEKFNDTCGLGKAFKWCSKMAFYVDGDVEQSRI